jgi:Core-2/I-Branching enzyme
VRIAYLILAHDQPAHLQRLVARLSAPGAAFFVHIDAKSDLAAFAALAPAVTFCKRRVNGAWGDISLVKATLELMKCAAAAPGGFDRYVLLSGACYPLYTPADIEAFFERHRSTEFIETFALPDTRYGKPLERITQVSIRKSKPLRRFRWPLQNFLNRVLPLRDYRKVLKGELVTGSQWWCLTGDAVKYVLDVTARAPQVYRFCKLVDCPDEFYFQYILWNSPFRQNISHSLTFTRWSPGKTGPDVLDAGYLPRFAGPVIHASEFKNSPGERRQVLFARKFSAASAPVLDAIDAMAAGRQPAMRGEEEISSKKSALTKVKNGTN